LTVFSCVLEVKVAQGWVPGPRLISKLYVLISELRYVENETGGLKPSYTTGEKVKWYRYFGKQSSKTSKISTQTSI
jgi:hypothetical protein